jgi:hypothetical protein
MTSKRSREEDRVSGQVKRQDGMSQKATILANE